jgi:putative NIF3 family GTP cyclohydrolase 1 type 2
MAATVGEILNYLNEIAPPVWAFPNDPIGLQIGEPSQKVERVLVALDPDPRTVVNAQYRQCQLLVTHHPLIFRPLSKIRFDDPVGMSVQGLCAAKIALIAVHTNWDVAPGGVNDTLAEVVGLTEVRPFGEGPAQKLYKLAVFTPTEHVDAVIDAMANAGAGVIGLYRRCAFYTAGHGHLRADGGREPLSWAGRQARACGRDAHRDAGSCRTAVGGRNGDATGAPLRRGRLRCLPAAYSGRACAGTNRRAAQADARQRTARLPRRAAGQPICAGCTASRAR